MIVGLCGFGYTGSGAVYDLLKEYTGLKIAKDYEISFLYRPDGLQDLQYHLMHPVRFFSSDYALLRFNNIIKSFFNVHPELWGLKSYKPIYELTEKYLDSLVDVKWQGWWSHDICNMNGFSLLLYRLLNKITSPFPSLNIRMQRSLYYRDMYLSVKPESFLITTQKYLEDLFLILGYDIDKETVVLNQPFSADNPSASYAFFKAAKAIVVDKDPRDLYIMLKRESFRDCAWTPTEKVEDFVNYYKLLRRNYTDINREHDLLIKFEDLVYEYDKSVTAIEKYIGVDSNTHINPKKFFNPKKSINNTQLFRKYPEMGKDIDYIEKKLDEYLFDYDKYPQLKEFGKSF